MDPKTDSLIGIPEFFKGKSIFLTGFTGSLGKLLAEKILYSCPEINKIYVIIRNKKGNTPQQRLEEVLKTKVFNRLRENYPGLLESKLVALSGDVLEERLGLTPEIEEILKKEVNIIYHGAATVRFDEPIKTSVNVNTLGTKRVIDLALKMDKLELFVHISTAYTNCDLIEIEEKLYPPKADWRKMIEVVDKVDPAQLQILHHKILENLPNTYVFAKNMGEHIINDYRKQLPVVICRPSIIVPALKEPIPGWIDNKYGPVGLMFVTFLGLLRCTWSDPKEYVNLIASDLISNAIIVATWKSCIEKKTHKSSESVKVFNLCTPPSCNVNNKVYSELMTKRLDCLHNDRVNFISIKLYRSLMLFRLNNIIKHVISAYIVDLILILNKRKPMLLKLRRLMFNAVISLGYFANRSFQFETKNFDSLLESINPRDQLTFGWEFSLETAYIVMINQFCYQASKETLLRLFFKDFNRNRKLVIMLYILDHGVVYLIHLLLAFILYYLGIPQALLTSLISFVTLPEKI